MIYRDYLMRLVQQLVQVLARILFLKRGRLYDEALKEIDRFLQQLFQKDPGEVHTLSADDLIAFCRSQKTDNYEPWFLLGDLFSEQGEILEAQNREVAALESYGRALGLYLDAVLSDDCRVTTETLNKVENLIKLTSRYPLSAAVLKRLMRYFELKGLFSEAENCLYEWFEINAQEAGPAGLNFYDRLAAKSDDELQSGKLPREELEEGRQELRRRQS